MKLEIRQKFVAFIFFPLNFLIILFCVFQLNIALAIKGYFLIPSIRKISDYNRVLINEFNN